jgi:hypothetical protein
MLNLVTRARDASRYIRKTPPEFRDDRVIVRVR